MKSVLSLGLLLFASSFYGQEWHKDLDEAMSEAKTEGKNVLLFFSVADACDSCRRLDRLIFQSPEFREYADKKLILVKMDFQGPVNAETKAENLLIVEKYNKDGFFPWVVLVDPSRKLLGKADMYDDQSPDDYLKMIRKLDN